jgi:hypothetical protein
LTSHDRKFKRAKKIWYTAFQPKTRPCTSQAFPPEILMDTTASDYIRHRLQRYEASVDYTRDHLRNPPASGNFTASTPYSEQSALPVLLDSLAAMPDEEAALRQEYARITKKLEVLARESGPGYRESLFKDLTNLAHTYHASACHASICNLPGEATTDPCRRRLINLLLAELRVDHDMSGIEALLSMIDNNLDGSVTVPEYDATGSPDNGKAYIGVSEPENVSLRGDSGQIRIE